jgi:regulator of replication initiation timing
MPSDGDLEGFPHPTIPAVIGIPTYETISEVNLQLNANAASVHSNLGDGAHGLLALTINPAVFNTLSAVAFVVPVNPGAQPVIPAGATNHQINAIQNQHKENHRIWKEYLATDKALKQMLLAAVNEMYYRSLRNRITGYANVSTLAILTHLYTTYGNINPTDLIENDSRMKKSYDPSQPIETLFDQYEDAIDFAAAANAAYTPAQIIAYAYNTVFQTGLFADACRDWRRLPIADKTWARFKADFAVAHQELRESQVTAQGAGFHSANLAHQESLHQQTFDALANLATATESDRSAVSNLTGTNSALTQQLTQTNQQLDAARADISALKSQLVTLMNNTTANANNNNNSSNNNSQRNNNNRSNHRNAPAVRKFFNDNYCWTHGYHISSDHTSKTCNGPKPGHRHEATRADTMGGTDRYKSLVM